MGMNWTRTSYLFLVLILISVGVTSAYALTITLGADPVNILGDLNVDGDIDVSGGLEAEGTIAGVTLNSFGNTIVDGDLDLTGTSAIDDDTIFFDDGTSTTLHWNESENRFEFGRDLLVQGSLDVFEGSITASGPGHLTITGLINIGNPDIEFIFNGVISIDDTFTSVAADTGTTDNLDTITGGTTGDLVILSANTVDTITVTTIGNIRLDEGSILILSKNDHAAFLFDGTNWLELFRTNPMT